MDECSGLIPCIYRRFKRKGHMFKQLSKEKEAQQRRKELEIMVVNNSNAVPRIWLRSGRKKMFCPNKNVYWKHRVQCKPFQQRWENDDVDAYLKHEGIWENGPYGPLLYSY
ncbi:hypothetical protein SUGI_0730240 [Cryptomeria japonica]|nr:hypothetical protein SUGI_0730240 [Cryptomeria japonica]